jgi:hypothetical protein
MAALPNWEYYKVLHPANLAEPKACPAFMLFPGALTRGDRRAIRKLSLLMLEDLPYRTAEKGQKVGSNGLIACSQDNWWIYDAMSACLQKANQRYGFHITGFTEPLRLRQYEVGESVPWHQDYGTDFHHFDMSKLTVVALISEREEFEGGDLQMMAHKLPKLRAGDVIVFPSYMPHRVTPVISGTRYSLAGWWSGPRFQ